MNSSGKICVVKGCPYAPIILDRTIDGKSYTFPAGDPNGNGFNGYAAPVFNWDASVVEDDREIWYCREHAVTYLFPLIDEAKGNTMGNILRDFADDGMM